MAIVKDIGTQITDEDIIQMGKGINPNVGITRVRRFNRKMIINNGTVFTKTTTSVIILEGTELPKYFELFNNKIELQLYIPPVMQCNKCLRYGHVQVHCRGKFRCYKCGEYYEDEKACDGEARCIYCNLPHYATNNVLNTLGTLKYGKLWHTITYR
ncbi:hypothetical protein HHI36_008014 [Cryptolaemus montrouzieri]|uniref:Nucleic-acid-binding protein from mobile element jockey n=1 Tax=Cryptolaemus montrouzieri TaxID=559131 RepID=A0ABD2MRT4_9CUCU